MAEDQQNVTEETDVTETDVTQDVKKDDATQETAVETAAPTEEATEVETTEEVAETDATTSEVEDAPASPPADPAPVAEASSGFAGYSGVLTGDVVKLEDLEHSSDEAEQKAMYDELAQMVESTLTNVSAHEIVAGRIVSISEKDVVIDIGFKSDGIVSKGEFDQELEPGQEVEVYLERIEDYQGQLVLSKTKADKVKRWQRIEKAHETEEILEGTIVRRIKGGMIVELFDGVEAFLPGSQIDVRPVRDFDAYLEKRMEFKIVKLNPANENIVVSHKALIEKDLEKQRDKILSTMEPGQILEGTVKNITDFGVFIDLGGVDGLLHITDLSWGRVSHPSELVSLDEKLNVVVLDYDQERQRISLGLKQLQPHPWDNIDERFTVEDTVEGKVVSITDYGAFVELEKGIEGLVHISEMSWTEHIKHPSQMVSLGQMVKVQILNIDHEGKKISLGMKQLEPDPWQDITNRYPAGTVMRGTVRNITNFGVFVEIEPGIDGLVHISDLSWTKKVRHPNEIVKKGQELDVVVLGIDIDERRISLGHKQIETNPWSQFSEVYAPGTETPAKIVRFEDKGLIVSLPLDVEAFLPSSELKNSANYQTAYAEGDDLESVMVTRFDMNQKEIIVSETAKEVVQAQAEKKEQVRAKREEKARERTEVSSYQKQARAKGPTTLGELSGLENLKATMEAQEAVDAQAANAAADEAPAAEAPEAPVAEAPDEATAEAPEETTADSTDEAPVAEADEVAADADEEKEEKA